MDNKDAGISDTYVCTYIVGKWCPTQSPKQKPRYSFTDHPSSKIHVDLAPVEIQVDTCTS